MKWEYNIVDFEIPSYDHNSEFVKKLNELGLLGWECYMIESIPCFDSYRLYLKRPIPQ